MNESGRVERVAVVGAGAAGLVAALRLAQRGYSVTVFERETRPGGLAASFKPFPSGDPLERFYHHVFRTDRRFLALVRELGLHERLRWYRPATVCARDGSVARLDSALSLARFPMLAVADRLRLGLALAALKATPTSLPFERVRAAAWLRRVAGEAAFETVFAPLFDSKFGAHAEDVSLAWLWARVHDRTASLGYLDGGFACMYETLVDRIRASGGEMRFGSAVTAIERQADASFRVSVSDRGESETFERVIATMPVAVLARLCPTLPSSYTARYATTPSLGARCVVLALDRPLTGAYWTNVCDRSMPFTVVVEHTQLVSRERYAGRHVVYLGNYGDFEPRDAAQLIEDFTPALRRLNPAFDSGWIIDRWVFSAPAAQPIVGPGFAARVPPLETPLPGLMVATLGQTYPHDRGQNYAVALGESIAGEIVRRSRIHATRDESRVRSRRRITAQASTRR